MPSLKTSNADTDRKKTVGNKFKQKIKKFNLTMTGAFDSGLS